MSVNPPSVQDAAVDSVDNFAVFFQLFLQNSEKRLNTDTLVEKGTGALYLNFINEIKYLWMGNIFIVYDIGRRRWFQTSPKICLLVNEHGHIAVKRQKLKKVSHQNDCSTGYVDAAALKTAARLTFPKGHFVSMPPEKMFTTLSF